MEIGCRLVSETDSLQLEIYISRERIEFYNTESSTSIHNFPPPIKTTQYYITYMSCVNNHIKPNIKVKQGHSKSTDFHEGMYDTLKQLNLM